MIAFLVLETLMVGTFCAPRSRALLRLLRGRPDPDVPDHRRWGGARARLLAFKFFLYTLLGSVLMLLAILRCTARPAPPTSRP
jgi:NADH-quinone oxidoreductase subunit M